MFIGAAGLGSTWKMARFTFKWNWDSCLIASTDNISFVLKPGIAILWNWSNSGICLKISCVQSFGEVRRLFLSLNVKRTPRKSQHDCSMTEWKGPPFTSRKKSTFWKKRASEFFAPGHSQSACWHIMICQWLHLAPTFHNTFFKNTVKRQVFSSKMCVETSHEYKLLYSNLWQNFTYCYNASLYR